MKRIALVAALLGVSMFVLAGVATAGKVGLAKTWVYDLDKTDGYTASATWTKEGLQLVKNGPTEVWLSSGAEFKGVEGQKLTQLSFDVKNVCGGGAPRFNVYTDQGQTGFFGCAHGVQTPAAASGWTHVEFNGTEPGAVPFNSTTIAGVEVMNDEQGTKVVRNISVNGILVDKFPRG